MHTGPHPPDIPTGSSPHASGGRTPSCPLSVASPSCRRRPRRRPSSRLSSRSRPRARSPRCPLPRPPESHRSHQRAAQGCRRGAHSRRRRARRRPRRHLSPSTRRYAPRRRRRRLATPTRAAIVTAHVIVAHPNPAVVSRRAAYASLRASNLTSVTIVIVTNRLATRTTHVSTLACLAGAGAGRLTSSRVPRRRATPCRRLTYLLTYLPPPTRARPF